MQRLPPPDLHLPPSEETRARERQHNSNENLYARNQPASHTTSPSSLFPPLPMASDADAVNDPRTSSVTVVPAAPPKPAKKRKHRGGKKRKNRRQSFAAPSETEGTVQSNNEPLRPRDPLEDGQITSPPPFYRRRTNRSDESLDSAALLDHRDHPMMRPRRESRLGVYSGGNLSRSPRFGGTPMRSSGNLEAGRKRTQSREQTPAFDPDDSDTEMPATDRTPLITGLAQHRAPADRSYGLFNARSRGSSKSSARKKSTSRAIPHHHPSHEEFDVNNPPSVPASPEMHPQIGTSDVTDPGFLSRSPNSRRGMQTRDALIDIDNDDDLLTRSNSLPGPDGYEYNERPSELRRNQTIALPVEGDVCFPNETMSEVGYDEEERMTQPMNRKRSRRREWPNLWVLEEWSHQEKEQRAEGTGIKKTSEPVLIGGRLRPKQFQWHRQDEDAPYRYTYFNDDFEDTIHSPSISELVQPGSSFRELFIPDPPLLEDSSESEDDMGSGEKIASPKPFSPRASQSQGPPQAPSLREAPSFHAPSIRGRMDSLIGEEIKRTSRAPSVQPLPRESGEQTPSVAPSNGPSPPKREKPKRYGPRPTFWLDVLSPTEQEMRVLCKAFGIHALTAEDIMMQEAREKVELFRHYYFLNYRTFEQDTESEDYLDPINMYVIVFRHGVITFHFSQSPHPANVRRRIRQLMDYLILSSDWISYAIIDDITDVYQPLIHDIETEVDDIDELILTALQDTNELQGSNPIKDLVSEKQPEERGTSGIDMLRRIGECRKKVMSLYRLLGNKADVIKGFSKRCNEQWEVAPKSEIGLYLGDIQDHILTMTSNLSHYETLLSRAHSNYLAQVSIRMNERQEQTSDVLGKLTVVGTIVLPMNIICGMWGMNVKVPGQDIDNLYWFWSITAGLIAFAVICYYFCKRVYGIV